MSDQNNRFPKIKKSINDFVSDEDGSITRSKLIAVGSMVLLMTMVSAIQAYAAHRSHSSHSSHSSTSYYRGHVSHVSHTSHSSGSGSHGSHSSHSSSTHSNHGSHSNHSNHASHASHTSHSNTASHSNSLYSSEGDVKYGPSVSNIPKADVPQSTEGYAKITLGDKPALTVPLISDIDQPQDIGAVDLDE